LATDFSDRVYLWLRSVFDVEVFPNLNESDLLRDDTVWSHNPNLLFPFGVVFAVCGVAVGGQNFRNNGIYLLLCSDIHRYHIG
jgi:hypothetical protein